MNWTAEQDAILRENWGKQSSAQIGITVGASRSAVIGRANRLHLQKLDRNQFRPTRIPSPRAHNNHLGRNGKRRKPPKLIEEIPVVPLREHLCTFDQLTQLKCHYPTWTGDPPFSDKFYCGMPTAAEGSYCVFHRRICYEPPRSRYGRVA